MRTQQDIDNLLSPAESQTTAWSGKESTKNKCEKITAMRCIIH